MNIKSIKLNILTVVFLYLVFQRALIYVLDMHALSYVDEGVTAILVLLLLVWIIRRKFSVTKLEWIMIAGMALFEIMGWISHFVHPYQTLFITATDALICCKFVIFYFAVRVLMDEEDTVGFLKRIAWTCRVIAVGMFLLSLHELFMKPFFPKDVARYGIEPLMLFFQHPTYLAFAGFTCALVLMLGMSREEVRKKPDLVFILMLFFVTCITLRTKAIAAVGGSIVIFVYLVVLKWERTVPLIVAGGVIVGGLGWKSFRDYYFQENAAPFNIRGMMHVDGLHLANQYFPLGTGFATYGSAAAADHYSDIYMSLGYNSIWGMSWGEPVYLCDTFWPIVYAQTGWIGTVGFVAAIAVFVITAFKAIKVDKYIAWTLLSVMVYQLISSIAETAFFNPASAMMFVVFAMGVNLLKKSNKTSEE